MRFDRRWRLVAALTGVLVIGVVLALLFAGGDGDGDDVATVASDSSTSTLVAAVASSSTTIASLAVPATSTTRAVGAPRRAVTTASTARATATTTTAAECSRPAPGSRFDGFGATEIVIHNVDGSHRSCVLTADTSAQQERGLMRQDDLDGYDGMIFRFPSAAERTFWMRNTRIALSIAFFGADGSFVSATDMEPCGDSPDCPQYSSHGAAQYALEVLKGGLPAVGGTAGSRLSV